LKMIYYYARVSSQKQNLARQIQLFKEMGGTDRTIFQEKKSGKSFKDRETWAELMEWCREGDIIVVKNLDRIGRNAEEVREQLVTLAQKGIIVESIDQAYLNEFLKDKLLNRQADSLAEAMINTMLDTMLQVDLLKAEWERKELRKRQQEGIERAKQRGQHMGRKTTKEFRTKFLEVYHLTRDKNNPKYMSVTAAAKYVGCSRTLFYALEKDYKNKKEICVNNCI
ncbi:MAG: recombinase family protein, partial [Sarcina sp.]